MTREDWRRVKEVTAAALDEPETERWLYVTRACGGDEPLEREVRSLLSSAISATPFFETPVFAARLSATAVDECVCTSIPITIIAIASYDRRGDRRDTPCPTSSHAERPSRQAN